MSFFSQDIVNKYSFLNIIVYFTVFIYVIYCLCYWYGSTMKMFSFVWCSPYITFCVFVACGGILKTTTGTFSAPQGEDGYMPSTQCKWVISAEPGWIIQLSWLAFHLEYTRDCFSDVVEVYENNTISGESQLIEKSVFICNYCQRLS